MLCHPLAHGSGRYCRLAASGARARHGGWCAAGTRRAWTFCRYGSWLGRHGVHSIGDRPRSFIDRGALRAPGQPPVLKAVIRIESHPQFDIKRLLNHLATADVALIKLAEPLPARISPALIAAGGETVAVGDSLVVAGYGVTARGDGRTGGTARAATLVVTGRP